MSWHLKTFEELTGHEIYNILRLRSRVFVLEQTCLYEDIDGLDPSCRHLFYEDSGEILAYARLLPAGLKYALASIGRVLVRVDQRHSGLGRELMRRAVDLSPKPVKIQAQAYLEAFYSSFGFLRISELYDEDGIAHIDMVKQNEKSVFLGI